MKLGLTLLVVGLWGVACAQAQMDATASASGAAPIQISDTEAAGIAQTINGYMQGPLHRGQLELFDRKKGETVSLRLDRIVTDDPERVIFPREGQVVICGECTQVVAVMNAKGAKTGEEDGDQYEVWFLLQRGGTVTSRVLDPFIKSVNGQPMYKWTRDEAGQYSATLVPDAP